MFRVVVVIGLAAVPVIVLGLAVSPLAGAILLAVELALGLFALWDRSRGAEPHRAEVAARDDGVYRLLVVANETVGGRTLLAEIERRCTGRPNEVRIVVPALTKSRLEYLTHDVDQAVADAQARLDHSLRTISSAGLRVGGQVGDHHDPNAAIEDALATFAADEVIISTHPPDRSRWLERGVVERAEREVPLPVTHVIVDLEAERVSG
jgi:hypothetical protein